MTVHMHGMFRPLRLSVQGLVLSLLAPRGGSAGVSYGPGASASACHGRVGVVPPLVIRQGGGGGH